MDVYVDMSFAKIDEIGLGLNTSDISDAFAPFVQRQADPKDAEWQEQLGRRKKKILLKSLKRFATAWLPSSKRSEDAILREYTEAWGEADYSRYDIHKPAPRYSPWEWQGECLLANTLGSTRFRQLMLIRLIEKLQPKTVLEVGCGDGINLLLLATQFPDIQFHGVELTEAGHKRAKRLQDEDSLPQNMLDFAPITVKDPAGHRRVNFTRGSVTDLEFDDRSKDLVFTILALEQMEQIRERALSEIARVTAGHTFMVEPFVEVNASGWRRWNVFRRDYFRGSINDLESFGLKPTWSTMDFPQETFLGAAAVLSEKV